jgi:glucan phosphoethanolaminetransferase (alkaline phosphatase superfamily)
MEVVSAFFGNYAAHLSIYLTLVFGYCVVAYAAGERLTRFQVVLVSLMFFCAAELQAFAMTNWVNRAYDVMVIMTSLNPDMVISSLLKSGVQLLGMVLWQLGIVASLCFMWSIRHPRPEPSLRPESDLSGA